MRKKHVFRALAVIALSGLVQGAVESASAQGAVAGAVQDFVADAAPDAVADAAPDAVADAAPARIYFSDDFQSAEVNNFAVAEVNPSSWTLYEDGHTPLSVISYFNKAWMIYRTDDGGMIAASPSYFTPAATADRWLLSRAVDLGEASAPVLFFRAKALDENNRDGFAVKLSTTGNAKEDFTETLLSVSRARTEWYTYELDLSAYKGQTVYIAFIQNSDDKYLLGLDDVYVMERTGAAAVVSGLRCQRAAVVENFPYSLALGAAALNTGSENLTGYTLCYKIDDGEVQRQTVSGLNVESGKTAEISLNISIDKAGTHSLSLYLENINGTEVSSPVSSTYTYCVKDADLPRQTAFFELFSSGTCHACAPWNDVLMPLFDSLQANTEGNPGNLVIAKYQVNIPSAGDPMVTDETLARSNFYGIVSAPSFYYKGKSYQPSATTYQSDICNLVEQCNRTYSPLGINANVERDGNTFKITAKITTYLPDPNRYNLLVCFVEDTIHLPNKQLNGEQDFHFIVRKMMPDAGGVAFTPAELNQTSTQEFTYTFDLKDPKIYALDNLNAVVYLQNTSNREIAVARYAKVGYTDRASNRKPARSKGSLTVYPNPAKGSTVHLRWESDRAQQASVRVFNLGGQEIMRFNWTVQTGMNYKDMNISGLGAGTYMVGVYGENSLTVRKLIVR